MSIEQSIIQFRQKDWYTSSYVLTLLEHSLNVQTRKNCFVIVLTPSPLLLYVLMISYLPPPASCSYCTQTQGGGGGRWNSFLCNEYDLPGVSLWYWHTPPDLRLLVLGSRVTGITFIMQSRSTSLCFMAGRFLAAWGTNVLFLAYNPSSRAGQNNIKKHLFSHNHGVTVPMYPLVVHNTCFKNATCYSYLHVIILLTNILIWSAFI